MKEIVTENWSRRGVYEAFRHLDFPFYHVAFRVDVTRLKSYTKQNDLSFYYSLVYLTAKSANSVENFRLRLIGGRIYDVGETTPSFTFLKPGSDAFQIATCRLTDTLDGFNRKAKAMTTAQKEFIAGDDVPADELLYISCLPWLDMTSASSERHLNPDDSIPRISWGKYTEDSRGKLTLTMAVDVNHKLIDGFHIGRLYETLQGLIDALPL